MRAFICTGTKYDTKVAYGVRMMLNFEYTHCTEIAHDTTVNICHSWRWQILSANDRVLMFRSWV